MTTNTATVKNYICTKEKYLELKALQKESATIGKSIKNERNLFTQARRKHYHGKGMIVPGYFYQFLNNEFISIDKKNGFELELNIKEKLEYREARYLNIIYGLVKGKTYKQIEQKIHESNKLRVFYLEKFCKKYGVDYSLIKELVKLEKLDCSVIRE